MKRWLSEVVVAVATACAVALTAPSQAHADTDEVLIYSACGAAVAIVIVLVATYFTRDEDQLFLTEPAPTAADDGRSIHAGADCVNPDGTVALLCW